MQIELPNSPGVTVNIDRGGIDPVTKEQMSDQWVQVSWDVVTVDDDGAETTRTERRGFLGPEL